jgi:hypothetical protein
MGGFRVRGGEPEENKQLTRKILDCEWLSVNAAASGRKRVEKKAGREISHFFAEECTERGSRVKGLRCASMNAAKNAAPLTHLPLRSVCFQPSKKCN